MAIKAFLFDLDGTLVDTAKDLGAAINHVLKLHKKTPLPDEVTRPFVSGGTPALVKLAFGVDAQSEQFELLKSEFLNYYQQNLCIHSHLYHGVSEALAELDSNNIPWGIVTNKPEYLTTPLLKQLKLLQRSHITISGDTYSVKKPDPYPLLQAAKAIKVNPQNIAYFGDDKRDIVAAKAANMMSVSVGWGYSANQNPLDWNATTHLKNSDSLNGFIKSSYSI